MTSYLFLMQCELYQPQLDPFQCLKVYSKELKFDVNNGILQTQNKLLYIVLNSYSLCS